MNKKTDNNYMPAQRPDLAAIMLTNYGKVRFQSAAFASIRVNAVQVDRLANNDDQANSIVNMDSAIKQLQDYRDEDSLIFNACVNEWMAEELQVGADWDEPRPLLAMTYPDEPTKECMPEVMWYACRAIATSRQARLAVTFPTALAAVVALLRGRVFVQRSEGSQRELVTLYTASIAGSGEGKSSTRSALLAPVNEVYAELNEKFNASMAVYVPRAKAAEQQIKSIQKELAESGGEEPTADQRTTLIECNRLLKNPPRSGLRIVSDTTSEALVDGIERHGFIAVHAGEGASLTSGFGRYTGSKGADLSPFLSAYDGEGVQSGRKGDGSYGTDSARAAIDLALQPKVLADIWGDGDLAGRGFINRLSMFISEPMAGEIKYHREFKPTASQEYAWRLANLNLAEVINDLEEDQTVMLGADADYAWADFAESWQPRLKAGRDLHHLSDFFNKRLPAQVLRFACIYHMIDGGSIEQPISIETMNQAIETGKLAARHYIAIADGCGFDEATNRACVVLNHIKESQLETFTIRDIYRKSWANMKSPREVSEVVDILAEKGWIRELQEQKQGMGRRPSTGYVVNPLSVKAAIF